MLKVFDLLGREVAILANEEKPGGSYSLQWNAANLPGGVYFYRIEEGPFVQTKKYCS
ncbi:MAG: T9SS type A sorting domain-containing protein [Ignavibacteriales bacterium]|nr:T9SS type A sorting domain-containing protein [Ignavibacteriales bacterium]